MEKMFQTSGIWRSMTDFCTYSIGSETGVCFMVANLVFYLLLFPLGRLALTN